VISGNGVARIPKTIKIVEFNPPEATICVAGVMNEDSPHRITSKTITVDIDDLVPLEAAEATKAKPGPLQMGYEPHMPRVPPFDFIKKHEDVDAAKSPGNRGLTGYCYCIFSG